jgi:tyrosine-protein kinase Etk/Wzc
LVGAMADIEKTLFELRMEREQMLQELTPQHPLVMGLDEKVAAVQQTRAQLESQLKGLPTEELKAVQLERSAKVSSELYVTMLDKAQELRISKAGEIGNVHIIDPAIVPGAPEWPKPASIYAGGIFVALLLSFAFLVGKRALINAVEVPELVERDLGLPIYAVVTRSEEQGKIAGEMKEARRRGTLVPGEAHLLALKSPSDAAVEGIRGFNTSLAFALSETGGHVVCLTGATPGVGKTFLSTNLAVVVAQSGRRVLVIDADLRRGHMHNFYGLAREPGLSDLVAGTASEAEVIRSTAAKVDVITCGRPPPNAAELLSRGRFRDLLKSLSQSYDLVIVDTPPTLNLADAPIVASACDATFIVVKCGKTRLTEARHAMRRLETAGVTTKGLIFNDLHARGRLYGYGNYYYRSNYYYSRRYG